MKASTFLLICLMSIGSAWAQSSSYATRDKPPRLYIKQDEQRGSFVAIQYEINYPGFVELHLFENEWVAEESRFVKKSLLIRGKVTDRAGLDYISFPVGPLSPGERYPYELHYKGDTITRSIVIR